MNENILNESVIKRDMAKSLNEGKKPTKEKWIRQAVEQLLLDSIAEDYIDRITDIIIDDVIEDINETADPERWNNDDVRLAIGRVILKKFGETV